MARKRGIEIWLGLIVGLVAYNSALNLLPTPRWLYVPANVALAVLLLLLGRGLGRSWEQLGFGPEQIPRGLLWGAAAALAAGLATLVAVVLADRLPFLGRLLADRRVAGVHGSVLVFFVLVRIPFGTAVLEEVAFRGVLFAEIRDARSLGAAIVVSSAAFGLWHIGPSLVAVRVNAPGAGVAAHVGGVAVAVAVTALAGLALAALRQVSDGLLAPVVAHAGANVFALLAATRG